jgi:AAA15 family ATPase/GTPase
MEACYLNIHPNISYALAGVMTTRYQIDLFYQLMKEVGIKYVYKFLKDESIKFIDNQIITNINNKTIQYSENECFDNKVDNSIIFIDTIKSSKNSLEQYYSKIIENKLENQIDKLVNQFDPSLDSFRIISSEPKCSLKSDGKFRNLNEFGDGLHKYITFICLLLSSKNTIIFIDEIDVGIHYSQFDNLWKLFLEISKKQNIQLFATTHSKECIESYCRVSNDLNETNISFIELGKDKQNNIKANIMTHEQFNRNIKIGNGVRGW